VDGLPQVQEAIKRLECEVRLQNALTHSKLTGPWREIIETTFKDRIFEAAELDAAIVKVKAAQATTDPGGRVTEGRLGGEGVRSGVSVGMTPEEKTEVEFMRMVMGYSKFRDLEHRKEPFVKERIMEAGAYKSWINAGKPNTGNYRRVGDLVYDLFGFDPLIDNRALEAVTTATVATVVKNTVNIFTAIDYAIQDRWYEDIVTTEEVDTIDQATLARLYGLDTLSIVEEGASYTSLTPADEEETADFIKRGNYVAVTLETMMRDKLNYIRTIPRRLADTWFNTLSSQTAGVFTTNSDAGPVLGTTGALFNATAVTTAGGHANLLTAALTAANFGLARTAMRKQTTGPLGVNRRAQINPAYLLVPEDLETTGLTIRNTEFLPGGANNDINPYYQKFEVVVVPEWTDTNNWALVGDPMRWPAIYHIFPRGNRTPAIFEDRAETGGAVFSNDSFRFKIRLMTFEFSSTYRVSPVADFRPLHKNNVA
jgi:hypothetical protein